MIKEIKREGLKHYLVIESNEEAYDDLQYHMLLNNHITHFLNLEFRYFNGKQVFYYEIDGMQTIHQCFEKQEPTQRQVFQIIKEILITIESLKEYYLHSDRLLLDAKNIYLNPETFDTNFCYLPGNLNDNLKPVNQQLRDLIEFFMNRINHKDEDLVVFIYGLYRVTGEENCSLESIKDYMKNTKKELDQKKMNTQEEYGVQQRKIIEDYRSIPSDHKELHKTKGNENKNRIQEPIKKALNEEKKVSPVNPLKTKLKNSYLIYLKGNPVFIGMIIFANLFTVLFFYYLVLYFNGIDQQRNTNKLGGCFILLLASITYLWDSTKKQKQKENTSMKQELILVQEAENYGKQNITHNTNLGSIKDSKDGETTVLITGIWSQYPSLCPKVTRGEESIAITQSPFVIGSLRDATDYCISDQTVSRLHAVIEKKEDAYYITDMHSTNGTIINGERIKSNEPFQLHSEDIIILGKKEYEYIA